MSTLMPNNKIILGIDPGYDRIGVAILEGSKNLLYSDCITTNPKDDFCDRLVMLGNDVEKLIKEYKPQLLSIEKLFFTTNQKTAMQVAEARGAIMYLARQHGLEIMEFTPMEIKVAVTGYGKATKENVHDMVRKLIDIPIKKTLDDEIDAIAIALTGEACQQSYQRGK